MIKSMPLYSYKKKPIGVQKRILTAISYTTMTIGALFLFWSFYPVVASEMYNRIFIQSDVLAPVPGNQANSVERGLAVKGTQQAFSTNLVDYTKASAWFIDSGNLDIHAYSSDIKEYTLSIPKLAIEDARVVVAGDDLLKGLIHYLPENPPGINGTVNIFGHSTTPALAKIGDYKERDDYKSIFTYLPTLEIGDSFYVTVDTVRYTYEVYDRVIIRPDQISALEPKYDTSYINLYTCVPLGSYAKRLQVKARLKASPI